MSVEELSFNSLEELARHTLITQEVLESSIQGYIKVACDVILEGTRSTFGEYQDGVGPFSAWQELAESTKEDRRRLGYPENEPLLRTGKLRDSYYTKVEGHEGGVGSELPEALAHEIGNPVRNLPARSTLGLAFAWFEAYAFKKSGAYLEATFQYGSETISSGRLMGRT